MSDDDQEIEELRRQYRKLRTDPEGFLAFADEGVRKNPTDPGAYFTRHQGWEHLGRLDLALQDLNTSIALEPSPVSLECRGGILRKMGRYEEAIEDFNHAQAMDPQGWKDAFLPLLRADCHARLGNETAAMADIANLRDDYWTPGLFGFPPGGKSVVAAEIHRRAVAARAQNAQR